MFDGSGPRLARIVLRIAGFWCLLFFRLFRLALIGGGSSGNLIALCACCASFAKVPVFSVWLYLFVRMPLFFFYWPNCISVFPGREVDPVLVSCCPKAAGTFPVLGSVAEVFHSSFCVSRGHFPVPCFHLSLVCCAEFFVDFELGSFAKFAVFAQFAVW